jgi:AP endonuclease-2
MFGALHADIITLQELKVTKVDHQAARVDGYMSFVSVPQVKKGYSGVGVYVRIPKQDEPWHVKQSLKVVKAEEGITGILTSYDTKVPYRDSDNCIGGYPQWDSDICSQIDSEGRCVVLELANNNVVISVYCPANSMGTEEGEQFRIQFIEAMFARIRNLRDMGKNVVLMGDINISRDLIDSAETISDLSKKGLIVKTEGRDFEELNKIHVLNFIRSTIPRLLLNEILIDSISKEEINSRPRVLVDTVRQVQGRKLGLYTVWNTLRNSRPGNFGSRIDLILVTESLAKCTRDANIWPFLMGSDHCPIFTDFDMEALCNKEETQLKTPTPKLEAKYVYKLSSGNIEAMFAMAKKRSTPSQSPPLSQTSTKPKVEHKVAKPVKRPAQLKANSITNFFKPKIEPKENLDREEDISSDASPQVTQPESQLKITGGKFVLHENIPMCKHNMECILKTAMTNGNKGRRFWTCSKSKGEITSPEDEDRFNCGFFQWK